MVDLRLYNIFISSPRILSGIHIFSVQPFGEDTDCKRHSSQTEHHAFVDYLSLKVLDEMKYVQIEDSQQNACSLLEMLSAGATAIKITLIWQSAVSIVTYTH